MQTQSGKKVNVQAYFQNEKSLELVVATAFANNNTDFGPEAIKRTIGSLKMMDIRPRQEHVEEAIKQGMTGKYYRIGKELTTYDICCWVRKYMDSEPKYLDVNDWFLRTKGITIEEYAEKGGWDIDGLRKTNEKVFNEIYR